MRRATVWLLGLQLLSTSEVFAQTPPNPPITGFAYVVANIDSSACLSCQSYGTGSCDCSSGSFPFATCTDGSTMQLLSYQYCAVYPLTDFNNPGYCFARLCIGGGDPRQNVALGGHAAQSVSFGPYPPQYNTALGYNALASANGLKWSGGYGNTAVGAYALESSTSGTGDVAVGSAALANLDNAAAPFSPTSNVAVGRYALYGLVQGTGNLAVGTLAGVGLTSGSNNIYVGDTGPESGQPESGTIRMGSSQSSTFIAGIRGATLTADPQPVYIDSYGQLGLFMPPARARAAEAVEPPARSGDDAGLLERRIQVQDEQIAALERALREQAAQLQALSLLLAAESRRPAGESVRPRGPVTVSDPPLPPAPSRSRHRFWRRRRE